MGKSPKSQAKGVNTWSVDKSGPIIIQLPQVANMNTWWLFLSQVCRNEKYCFCLWKGNVTAKEQQRVRQASPVSLVEALLRSLAKKLTKFKYLIWIFIRAASSGKGQGMDAYEGVLHSSSMSGYINTQTCSFLSVSPDVAGGNFQETELQCRKLLVKQIVCTNGIWSSQEMFLLSFDFSTKTWVYFSLDDWKQS